MVIKLYVSRTSGNVLMKVQQEHIKRIFDSKNIAYKEIDVGDPHQHVEKGFMQTSLKLTDEEMVALPPQIFKADKYRGDYDAFLRAVEVENLYTYLDLDIPKHEVEYLRKQEHQA